MKYALGTAEKISQNVGRVIYGKDRQIRLALCCWFSGGHVLLEDCPGTGKTMLARAIAKSVNVPFQRLQFTPDLLPSDILGCYIYDQKKTKFFLYKGPVFTTILLGDEINRASPRTQSALLESMAECQVTVEGKTHSLDPFFFVIATQNPIEQHGTFPLPEAQLDRFMMRLSMGYPEPTEEIAIVKNQNRIHPIHQLRAVADYKELQRIREVVPQITISEQIYDYAVTLVGMTRKSPDLTLGASPRGTLALLRGAQALAFFGGLDHVRPHHLQELFAPVLAHRLIPTAEATYSKKPVAKILQDLVEAVPVPVS